MTDMTVMYHVDVALHRNFWGQRVTFTANNGGITECIISNVQMPLTAE